MTLPANATLRIYARVEYDGGRIVETRHANGWEIGFRGANPDTRYLPPAVSLWDRIRLRIVRWLCDPVPAPVTVGPTCPKCQRDRDYFRAAGVEGWTCPTCDVRVLSSLTPSEPDPT